MNNFFGRKLRRIPVSVWILCVIIAVGIFFRTYHFGEWLLFKGDAFRDAVLVSHIPEDGLGSLPLLGPRAGGTELHLGPIFYYFQALSVVLFRSTSAPVLAYPDLLFSMLTVPLIFLFVRRYFSVAWALAIAAMLSVSYFAIEYGRFAWNPNAVPFWTLLFLYALLRTFDDMGTRRVWWSMVAGVALGVASQLHFSAFLGLPVITTVFFLWYRLVWRKTLSCKIPAAFFAAVAIIYIPVIMNELITSGGNIHEFMKAIGDKGESQGMLIYNVWHDAGIFGEYSLRILTGQLSGSRAEYASAFLVSLAGLIANFFLYRSETDMRKRQFLFLSLAFVIIYFVIYIPLAFRIDRPRFFLLFLFLPYMLVGYLFLWLERIGFRRTARFGSVLAVAFILVSNLGMTSRFMGELGAAHRTTPITEEKDTLKGRDFWWTWGHFERAAAVMNARCSNSVLAYTMSKDTRDYDHSVEYALRQGSPREYVLVERRYQGPGVAGCYFYVSLPGEAFPTFMDGSRHDESIDAGGIAVTEWYPNDAMMTYDPDSKAVSSSLEKKIKRHDRLSWDDVAQWAVGLYLRR